MSLIRSNSQLDPTVNLSDSEFEDTNWSEMRASALEELGDTIRDLVARANALKDENNILRAEIRQVQQRENRLQDEKTGMEKDLKFALSAVEELIDRLTVGE